MNEKVLLDYLSHTKSSLTELSNIDYQIDQLYKPIKSETTNNYKLPIIVLFTLLGLIAITGYINEYIILGFLVLFIFITIQLINTYRSRKSSSIENDKMIKERLIRIQSLKARREELKQNLLSIVDIPKDYLSINAINRFEYFIRNKLAYSLEDCFPLYENELNNEKNINKFEQILKNRMNQIEQNFHSKLEKSNKRYEKLEESINELIEMNRKLKYDFDEFRNNKP